MLSFIICTSCQENGPKSTYYELGRSTEEVVQDVFDAYNGNKWYHEYDVDLHYKLEGKWYNAGRYSVYNNVSDDATPGNHYVDMGEDIKIPIEKTDYAGYDWCATYEGRTYYW